MNRLFVMSSRHVTTISDTCCTSVEEFTCIDVLVNIHQIENQVGRYDASRVLDMSQPSCTQNGAILWCLHAYVYFCHAMERATNWHVQCTLWTQTGTLFGRELTWKMVLLQVYDFVYQYTKKKDRARFPFFKFSRFMWFFSQTGQNCEPRHW